MKMGWHTHQMVELDGNSYACVGIHHTGLSRVKGLASRASAVSWTIWNTDGYRPWIGSYTLASEFEYQ